MKKIPVGILGATSLIGQHYLNLLKDHPWFEVVFLGGSDRSAGKSYREAVKSSWVLPEPICCDLEVSHLDEVTKAKQLCHFVFSALPNDMAALYEEKYAAMGLPVISNASCHRQVDDIPCLIAEINHDHLELIPQQQKKRGWKGGFIITKPNCAIQSFMLPLTPLHRKWNINQIHVTTLQSMSGAGVLGLGALNNYDNIIPYIEGEESKVEKEPLKIWGSKTHTGIVHAEMKIGAQCNRVPVRYGHHACVSFKLEKKAEKQEILDLWKTFQGLPQELQLPTAPPSCVIYEPEDPRPQNKLDTSREKGMSAIVGRLRECPLFDFRFVSLSHNALRGGAGGGVLNAELLYKLNYIQ
jgi:aspartate-semialdehyde dehydrogenase